MLHIKYSESDNELRYHNVFWYSFYYYTKIGVFTQRFSILYFYSMNDIHNDFMTFQISNLFLRSWCQKTLRWLHIWKNMISSISISKCKKSNELILCLTKHYYISFCVNILHSEEAFMHLGVFSELAVSLSQLCLFKSKILQDVLTIHKCHPG